MKRLEEIEIYNDGVKLAKMFRKFFKTMNNSDQFSYGQQMLRSSCSIPSNIAEGFGKKTTNKMLLNYLYITKGSLYEFKTQLVIIEDDYKNQEIDEMKLIVNSIDNGLSKFIFFVEKS